MGVALQPHCSAFGRRSRISKALRERPANEAGPKRLSMEVPRFMTSILWLITILLGVLWLLGYAVNIGAWINFLLIVAVILLVFNILSWMTSRGRHTNPD